jgi:hypothetical protein
MTEASFVISWNIAGAKRPYTDGEFVQKILVKLFQFWVQITQTFRDWIQISVPRHTTEKRISHISVNTDRKTKSYFKNCMAFCFYPWWFHTYSS